MKTNRVAFRVMTGVLGAIAFAAPAWSQQWEVGGLGGGALYLSNAVSGPRGTGSAGFKPGFAVGGWLGHNSVGRYSGEIRYMFQRNPMKVSSGGTTADFGGQSHILHYDVLIHMNSREDTMRPYFVVGGGLKGYIGTGTERAFQPLSNIAILSRTTQWQPVMTFGAGVKWMIGARTMVRLELRDYFGPFPKDVILPAPGNKVSGWVHDLTPTVGISYLFQ